ncbi:hypothetical protein [Endozoicomonas arenosclerae]|uniref:hypothetical protein n=1 Tax=Endozoicomonas arenosclerae TaxID=1633495 RepID=UPI000781623A|nr:hypothetical protein [Endozoicomonas arenosclerae]
MSLEARVQQLEIKQRLQDDCLGRVIQVIDGTHEVVSLILKEQIETRKDIAAINTRLDKIESHFSQFGTRFDQLELLIRQSHADH